jgi:hypothetical protein
MDTIGNFLSQNSSTLGSLASTATSLYGQQNAGEAISSAATAGIGQAQGYLGNVYSAYSPYTTAGGNAAAALSSAEGTNGSAPNYSGFENMPGYQFAVNQGTQAIQRQAASMGSAYTPNTAQAVGQYVTGTAMQDYNNYISQLQATAGMGETAASGLSSANLQTAGNIEQLGMNSGLAQAGIYTGATGTGGVNASGTGSGTSGIGGLIGSGLNLLGSVLGGSSSSSSSDGNPFAGSLGSDPVTSETASSDAMAGMQNINVDDPYGGSTPDFLSGVDSQDF